jgi:uncharacterized membrane protein (UPF0136 family)
MAIPAESAQKHFRFSEYLINLRPMLNIARIYYFVFAAFTAAGGVMGFVKASSKPSLIAGVISGLLLAGAGMWMPSNAKGGCSLGIVISALLLGRFLPAYLKKGARMPALPMIILSVIGIILAVIALIRS